MKPTHKPKKNHPTHLAQNKALEGKIQESPHVTGVKNLLTGVGPSLVLRTFSTLFSCYPAPSLGLFYMAAGTVTGFPYKHTSAAHLGHSA